MCLILRGTPDTKVARHREGPTLFRKKGHIPKLPVVAPPLVVAPCRGAVLGVQPRPPWNQEWNSFSQNVTGE